MNYKILKVGNTVACSAVQLGGGVMRRLEPGEVVDPCDAEINGDKVRDIFDRLVKAEKMVKTDEDPTRPLEFASMGEAIITAPGYVSKNATQRENRERALKRIADNLKPKRGRPPKNDDNT